ncbi:MAG: hypothetical protein COW00_07500 [Bdellovibrio sp. CG12_big_fil_rev_8_21_14_0_65_39_13]|nr:MAG: hypothetical protein COW78_10565 [Bdellovibrio sp. CG22_combo_CG10-13_8_21_14_all_39_27]PIQ60215.1 MAG: hypothetical protein COW00_07500 [Bdellovibrio sp. CG12_big_fil_rev_8_21_14_0_65_39_13]PIR32354.1 MAG: hypothetical protein COV37_20130 [Bdellovibrio sp. CG11_big_fil_rev_8_21_14_0_20_39_38]PJB54492.1 MAG: hypothetical protein CO099_01260 [Bdellovibrio sp. CG_4_9_14_3_um_filter_39_7]
MLRAPSKRKFKRKQERLNLVPILDAVFIFIFFLLMSANFVKMFEISSDVPIISNAEPEDKTPPLALSLQISNSQLILQKGIPAKTLATFGKNADGTYQTEDLRRLLIKLKKQYMKEKTIILEPLVDIKYEELVNIMDAVRTLRNTDEEIYLKDKNGIDVRVKSLFDNIIFGNIQS